MARSFQLVQTTDRNVNQLQQSIAQAVNPLLLNPVTQGNLLTGISLIAGTNTINHGLNTILQGWIVVGINGVASIYDTQSSNPAPGKTLILVSNAAVTVNLYVF